MRKYVVSIDPGRNGAIVLSTYADSEEMSIVDTFQIETEKGVKHYSSETIQAIFNKLEDWHMLIERTYELSKGANDNWSIDLIIEEPFAGNGLSSTSVLTTGTNYGALKAVAMLALRAEATLVRPSVWKKCLDLNGKDKTKTEIKHESLTLARVIFPEAAHLIPLVKHHDMAEAMLIGYYHFAKENKLL